MSRLLIVDLLALLNVAVLLVTIAILVVILRRLAAFTGHFRYALERNGISSWVAAVVLFGCVAGIVATWIVGTGSVEGSLDATYIVGFFLFFGGAVLVTVAVSRRSEYTLLTTAREQDAGSVAHGETVWVSGTATPTSTPTRAPFSETKCLAYDARSERRVDSIRFDASSWVVNDRTVDAVPFVVSDDTGAVLVDPSSPTVDLRSDYERVRDDSTADDGIRDADRGPRYYERRLDPDDPVHVVGAVDTDGDGRTGIGGREMIVTDRDPHRLRQEVIKDVKRNGPMGVGMVLVGYGLMVAAVL
jgi:hypothetical protein